MHGYQTRPPITEFVTFFVDFRDCCELSNDDKWRFPRLSLLPVSRGYLPRLSDEGILTLQAGHSSRGGQKALYTYAE